MGHARRSTTASFDGVPLASGRSCSRNWRQQAVRRPNSCSTAHTSRHTAAPPAEKGQQNQAIGISRGGRTTKIHALTDGLDRPVAFSFTGGQAADCGAAEVLLQDLPRKVLVMADRAYDTDAVRQQIETQGAVPNIPPKSTRILKSDFSPVLYRGRNAIERMFCRLKDYRRIATRYDELATNFASAVYLAAAVSYWLW